MPSMKRLSANTAITLMLTLVASAALIASAATARAGSSGGGGQCTVNERGQWITVQCGYGGGTGGTTGTGVSGGRTATQTTCTFTPIGTAGAEELGLAWPPPKGMAWDLMDCGRPLRLDFLVLSDPGPIAVLVNKATGQPAVTPQQLLQRALGELQIPALKPDTAPPLGRGGLVGLPEWFWISAAAWHQVSVTVRAGPVWATATATPDRLTFQPGGGLSATSCAGPGEPYDPARAAAGQHTSCSYTYEQSSLDQPGHAYQAAVVVNWRIRWTGSGGTGGLVNPAVPVASAFSLPVAQGEALVITP